MTTTAPTSKAGSMASTQARRAAWARAAPVAPPGDPGHRQGSAHRPQNGVRRRRGEGMDDPLELRLGGVEIPQQRR